MDWQEWKKSQENVKTESHQVGTNEVVLEVRAGAGGDEASLFAWELAHMYELFSTIKGWQWKTNYESKSELGGYKEASFEIKGKDVYKMMRFETGVHRVQRIPATEKMDECILLPLRWLCFRFAKKFYLKLIRLIWKWNIRVPAEKEDRM